MGVEKDAVRSGKAIWQNEIEHAIDNVKRTKLDRWMRREWHKAGARKRWSEGRKAGWRRKGCDGESRGRQSRPFRSR